MPRVVEVSAQTANMAIQTTIDSLIFMVLSQDVAKG